MAVLRDKEEEKGQGTSQALGQPVPGQMQPQEQAEPQQAQPSGPATIGGSSATQTSAPVKAMPKQQKAGTGSFANLKTYLQAAQGGGQQKVAQAATQQVQRLGAGAQKGVQQAQESFGRQMQAGSGAVFQGEQGQALSQEEASSRAQQRAQEAINAARAVTYQAPQVTAQAEGEAPTQAPVPVQPQQYFTPEQQQRFAEIINAQYQGPASLQQAGLYEQAARKARTAQQAGELTQTAGGREQLLRDVFGRGRDYSRGASRLDALLLNASEQGVQQLQQQAQPALQAQQALQEAQNVSANEAAQRVRDIEKIRTGARTAFTEARTAEEQATEKRIDDLIKTPAVDESGNLIQKLDTTGKPIFDAQGKPVYLTEWDRLPAYFQDIFRQRQVNKELPLSEREAGILGLSSGQGLFNIGQEAIDKVVAERERLITKDELARQLALQQLAGLDVSKGLQKDLKYTDLEKAGTQNLESSLDVDKFKRSLEERVSNLKFNTGRFKGQSVLESLNKLGLKEKNPNPSSILNFVNKKIVDAQRALNNKQKEYKSAVVGGASPRVQVSYSKQLDTLKNEVNEMNNILKELNSAGIYNVVKREKSDLERSKALKDILNE